uniref:Uncharacterized protein n=1 Tax=Manihot esculenta TaxID=3983 RepID=A0A2C9WL72_MANES
MRRKLQEMMYQIGNASTITLSYTGTIFQFLRVPCAQLSIHLFDGKAVLCRIYNKHARDFHKKEQVGVDYSNCEAIVPYVKKKQVSLADDKEGNQHPTKKMKKQRSIADDEEGHQNSKKMKQQEPVDLYGESIGSTSCCPSNFVVEQLPVSSDYSSRFPEDEAVFLADGELNSLLDFPSDYDLTSLLLDMDVGTGTFPEDELSKFLAENIDDGGFFSSMPPLTMQCNKVNKDDENGNNLSSSMPLQGGLCDRNAVLRDVN